MEHKRVALAVIETDYLRYTSRPQDLRPHNLLKPLRDGGQTYPAMLGAIRAAKVSVHLETYILKADSIGRRFAEVLAERARAGVTVRVIYDSFGSMGIADDFLDDLRSAGVFIAEYNPIAPWRKRFALLRRNHRKVLVVDDCVAFTGGLNIGEDYASIEDGGLGWRDTHVQVEGPIVTDLARLFHGTWRKCGGEDFPLPDTGTEVQIGTALARVVNNRELKQRYRFRKAYRHAIKGASRSVDIMNAYFLPGLLLRRALRKAVKRGVTVRVIVPGDSDVKLVQLACEHLYPSFLRAGIKVYEWTGHMVHAKTAVIDGVWATIGSYNLDSQSLLQNLEVAVAAVDPPFAAVLQAEFNADLAHCTRITREHLKRRTLWRRVKCWLAYRLRRWL